MNIGKIANNVNLYLDGFKKIKMTDTKGVLGENNFKWVKYSSKNHTHTTVLQTGTKIVKQACPELRIRTITVHKPNGDHFASSMDNASKKCYLSTKTQANGQEFDIIKFSKKLINKAFIKNMGPINLN